jgi:hypothetical protein
MHTPFTALALLAAVLILAGCGQTPDPDDAGDADDPAAEVDTDQPADPAEEPDEDQAAAAGPCGMPDFSPDRLPWDDEPGNPDRVEARNDVTALVWFAPDEGSLQILKGQPRPTQIEVSQTVDVRGNEAVLWWTGEPGGGLLSAHWTEDDDPCEQYMVVLGPAQDESQMLDVIPD